MEDHFKEQKPKQSIPSLAYLIVGILIVVASYIIDRKKMILFMIAGAVFIMIGVVKLIFSGEKKQEERIVNLEKKGLTREQMNYKYCAMCGNRMHFQERFCRRCGAQSLTPDHMDKYNSIRMKRYHG